MILDVSPDSSAVVRGAATTILYLHIGGGLAGIASGATAMLMRKGGQAHRVVGNVFFVSMLIMAFIGAVVSPFLPEPQWVNVFMAVFVLYLIATSRATVRRNESSTGRFELGAFIVALSIAITALVVGTLAVSKPNGTIDDLDYRVAFGFGAVWTLVAIADCKLILRGGVSGAQRLVRHLWRMCVALLIAVVSLFLGQAQMFPTSVRGTGALFVPAIAVLGSLLYWLWRVRFAKRGKRFTVPAQLPSVPSPPTTAY
jgi:uncharacterized membrane protein